MTRTTLLQTAASALLVTCLASGSPQGFQDAAPRPRAHSLRFFGNGVGDIDRVKIRIDDPATSLPGPPVDVGATDFTIEFWLKSEATDNGAGPISCGQNIDWIYGNIVLDRDRFGQGRKYGVALAGGVVVFGVSVDDSVWPRDRTICGQTDVRDGQWHHVALTRRISDGWLELYVDGTREAWADGPDGDLSYPDDGVPGPYCGGPCVNSDPFIVLAAEKHDAGPAYPSFSGWLDELRFSDVVRYSADFVPPGAAFPRDAATVGLYHFDEGSGDHVADSSPFASHGERRFGGSPAGPLWSTDTPF